MKNAETIRGTVKKIDIGTGFWGIITDKNEEYRPVNLAPALQKEGQKVTLKVVPAKEEFSIHMWGIAVEVV